MDLQDREVQDGCQTALQLSLLVTVVVPLTLAAPQDAVAQGEECSFCITCQYDPSQLTFLNGGVLSWGNVLGFLQDWGCIHYQCSHMIQCPGGGGDEEIKLAASAIANNDAETIRRLLKHKMRRRDLIPVHSD